MGAKTKFTELVRTADSISGTIDVDKLQGRSHRPAAAAAATGADQARGAIFWPPGFAARREAAAAEASRARRPRPSKSSRQPRSAKSDDKGGINAIYVADIDLLSSHFVQHAERAEHVDSQIPLRQCAVRLQLDRRGRRRDSAILEIRKRKPKHSTLEANRGPARPRPAKNSPRRWRTSKRNTTKR